MTGALGSQTASIARIHGVSEARGRVNSLVFCSCVGLWLVVSRDWHVCGLKYCQCHGTVAAKREGRGVFQNAAATGKI